MKKKEDGKAGDSRRVVNISLPLPDVINTLIGYDTAMSLLAPILAKCPELLGKSELERTSTAARMAVGGLSKNHLQQEIDDVFNSGTMTLDELKKVMESSNKVIMQEGFDLLKTIAQKIGGA